MQNLEKAPFFSCYGQEELIVNKAVRVQQPAEIVWEGKRLQFPTFIPPLRLFLL